MSDEVEMDARLQDLT